MSRIPFVTFVVGALLIGGATTGGTHASWVKSAPLAQSSVKSGAMGYTATNPGGVTVTKVAGSVADTSITVHDTSVGKNLKQRITASVTGKPTGVTATVSTSCGSGNAYVDSTPGAADQTFCVRVTSSTTAVGGNVTVSLSSAQLPSAGWTTAAITRNVAVTVQNPVSAPGAPSLSCGTSTTNDHTFSWLAVSGADSYTVYRSDGSNVDSAYGSVLSGTTSTNYVATFTGNQTSFFRVKAVNTGGTSGFSNTLRIVRSGSTVTCTKVTP